ncbi:SAM-dependent methyltransferase [Dactylosporangium darangshiense]|uniref:SAM-dependent methyltransferase n=1 Tax=Dactylosporangium darangshiense TaxID=579108 RepID=A0ABP8D642_9ACTN
MTAPWRGGSDGAEAAPTPVIDTSVPHPARRYNYWLGGKDNFAADRESGDKIAAVYPPIRTAALANRRFLERAVAFLAEQGVGQFLDIGTGIPVSPNTHEIAQEIRAGARVVYVDNDPIVLSHARALLTSAPGGMTAYLDADMREPEALLSDPALRKVLDLDAPVAILLISVLHFAPDARAIVGPLLDAVPAGSYIALTHLSKDLLTPDVAAQTDAVNQRSGVEMWFRGRDAIEGLVDGLEILPPGVVPVAEWRPVDDPAERPTPDQASLFALIARK